MLATRTAFAHGYTRLSAREREVAELVSLGHTNRQIAERLVITRRTTENHMQHIFEKLGLSSRAQLAVWVVLGGGETSRATLGQAA
jgi:DNA-binding CsgD family transcriptional regulator